jgi:hypothetical protein
VFSYEHYPNAYVKNTEIITFETTPETMKTYLKTCLLAALLLPAIISCKKDDTSSPKNNAITFKGTEYPLHNGYLEYYGQVAAQHSYNIDLTVVSSGIVVHEANGEIDSISGNGNVMYFELFTSDSARIPSGTYKFDINQTYAANTFDHGAIGLNINIATMDAEYYFGIIDGNLKIKDLGTENSYEVILSAKNTLGSNVTAYFKGTFSYYDYGDVNMKKASEGFRFKKLTTNN